MPDNRRFKGRNSALEALLYAIGDELGSKVEANPDYKLAVAGQDATFIEKDSPTERALRDGAENKPFKAGNIMAKGNTNRANADFQDRQFDLQNRESMQLRIMAKQAELEIDNALKLGKITEDQAAALYERLTPLTVDRERQVGETRSKINVDEEGKKQDIIAKSNRKQGNDKVVNASGMLASDENLGEYNKTTFGNALQAANTGFQSTSANNIAAKKKADLASQATDLTGPDILDNMQYDANQYQRNAEADYVNKVTTPVGEGQSIVDIRNGGVVAKAPSMLDQLTGGINPQQNNAAVRNYGSQRITLSNGQVAVGGKPTAPPANVPAPQPEQATEVVKQPSRQAPTNVWDQKPYMIQSKPQVQASPDGGKWVLINGRYQFVPDPQPKVTAIPAR
jgi:hypothetical protein